MIHLYVALGITLLALGGAVYALIQQAKTPRERAPYDEIALILAATVALIAPHYPSFFYKGCVALALLLLATGRLLLLIPKTPRVVAQATNLVVHFLLWLGFLITIGRAFWGWPLLLALAGMGAGAGVALLFWGRLAARREGELKITLLVYGLNAGLMVGGAAALLLHTPALWSGLALGGALLLALEDGLRASDRWRRPMAHLEFWAVPAVMAASLLLAWSVWGY